MHEASLNSSYCSSAHTPKQTINYPTVDSVVKALSILDCFNKQEVELSLKDLCLKTGLYKSRVHRLCATLTESGYLVRSSRTNYRLGPKVFYLGKSYEYGNSLKSVALPHMENLSCETCESTALFCLDNSRSICLAREVSKSRLMVKIEEGDDMPLTLTAAGRVLLAYSSNQFTETVLKESQIIRWPNNTNIVPVNIREELEEIKKKGYSFNGEELEIGISAVASPIFDYKGKVIAALAIVGPSQRFKGKERNGLIGSLLEASGKISKCL